MSEKYYQCSECEAVNLGDGPCPKCQVASSLAAPIGSVYRNKRTGSLAKLISKFKDGVEMKHEHRGTVRRQSWHTFKTFWRLESSEVTPPWIPISTMVDGNCDKWGRSRLDTPNSSY